MDNTSRQRAAERRHKHFPQAACLAHLIFYGEPLCPERRGRGSKLCKDHATRVAEAIGWKPSAVWDDEQRAQLKAAKAEADSLRKQLSIEMDDNHATRRELRELKALPPAERHRTERPEDGTIYALLSGYNVKIGWTSRDLVDRLREYPPNSTVLVAYPGKRGEETKLKRKFAHLRTHGAEWFPYAPQITEWVDQMVTKHGPPDPSWTCGPAKAEPPRPHADRPVLRPRDWRGSRPA